MIVGKICQLPEPSLNSNLILLLEYELNLIDEDHRIEQKYKFPIDIQVLKLT